MYNTTNDGEFRTEFRKQIESRLKIMPASPAYSEIDFGNINEEVAKKEYEVYESLENDPQEGRYLFTVEELRKAIKQAGNDPHLTEALRKGMAPIERIITDYVNELIRRADNTGQELSAITSKWYDVEVRDYTRKNKGKLVFQAPDFWYPLGV